MNDVVRFAEDYYRRWMAVLESLEHAPIAAILEVLRSVADHSGTLWLAGNGGSAAVADHAACDLMTAAHAAGWQPGLRCVSLGANKAVLTALANDVTFDDVFRRQLIMVLGAEDAVMLISSSGNSSNILKAARYARQRGVPTIALVGFDGGELAGLADPVLWVPSDSYGMCEDAHQSVIHVLAQYLGGQHEVNETNDKPVADRFRHGR